MNAVDWSNSHRLKKNRSFIKRYIYSISDILIFALVMLNLIFLVIQEVTIQRVYALIWCILFWGTSLILEERKKKYILGAMMVLGSVIGVVDVCFYSSDYGMPFIAILTAGCIGWFIYAEDDRVRLGALVMMLIGFGMICLTKDWSGMLGCVVVFVVGLTLELIKTIRIQRCHGYQNKFNRWLVPVFTFFALFIILNFIQHNQLFEGMYEQTKMIASQGLTKSGFLIMLQSQGALMVCIYTLFLVTLCYVGIKRWVMVKKSKLQDQVDMWVYVPLMLMAIHYIVQFVFDSGTIQLLIFWGILCGLLYDRKLPELALDKNRTRRGIFG